MNTEQKLTKIRQKCVELLAKYPKCESTAGWKATIAAIDLLTNDGTDYARYEPELKKLIATWEGIV